MFSYRENKLKTLIHRRWGERPFHRGRLWRLDKLPRVRGKNTPIRAFCDWEPIVEALFVLVTLGRP